MPAYLKIVFAGNTRGRSCGTEGQDPRIFARTRTRVDYLELRRLGCRDLIAGTSNKGPALRWEDLIAAPSGNYMRQFDRPI
jgi:hypothetical protein